MEFKEKSRFSNDVVVVGDHLKHNSSVRNLQTTNWLIHLIIRLLIYFYFPLRYGPCLQGEREKIYERRTIKTVVSLTYE